MAAYMLRRLIVAIPVMVGVSGITFLLMHAAAGSYLPGLEVSPNLQPADIERIRATLGVDQPLHRQYIRWLGGVVHGDFGRSLIDGAPVLDHILDRLPNTLLLNVVAMVVGIAVAVPLGILAAQYRGGRLDNLLTFGSVVGVSIPVFWLGLLLILVFSVGMRSWGLPALPSSGTHTPFTGGGFMDRVAHLVLPATCLASGYIAIFSRFTRSAMLEVLGQDYVRTAHAKGLPGLRVTLRHAFPNAGITLITLLGLELPGLLAGGAVVEIVFGWPGIGRLALERALAYDYTVVLGIATFSAFLVIAGSLMADILYRLADPRVRA